jgi:hypothetical protein
MVDRDEHPSTCSTTTAAAGDSTLARIATAIQETKAQRAPTRRLVNRFAHYDTPAVVALAVLVARLGPLLFGGTRGAWVYQALVMLVIALPLRPGAVHPDHRPPPPDRSTSECGRSRCPWRRPAWVGDRPAGRYGGSVGGKGH